MPSYLVFSSISSLLEQTDLKKQMNYDDLKFNYRIFQ